MAKEWILNSAMNRFQLNFKRNVGATSEEIRKCQPRTLDEWEQYYYQNVRPKEHIDDLGRRLYIKITEVIAAEVDEITEEDCINYMHQMVINRTFDGYMTEIKTIYGQLQNMLGDKYKIKPAPDKWDRLYNVDFFIKVKDRYIGLQIKPVSHTSQIPEMFKERQIQNNTHVKFKKTFGGNVFYVFSRKVGNKKRIQNPEVVAEILNEIQMLEKMRRTSKIYGIIRYCKSTPTHCVFCSL